MRILQVSDSYYPFRGGVAEHIFHLSVELRKLGHEVYILTAKYPNFEERDPFVYRVGKVVILPPLRIFNYTNLTVTVVNPLKIREFLRSGSFDVVHTHGPLSFNLPQIALHYSKSCNVATFHTVFVGFNYNKIFKIFFGNYAKKIRAAIFVSKTAEKEADVFGFRKKFVVPNGVDIRRFSPEGERIEFQKRPVVLFVGRLERRKGVDIVIKAVKGLDVELVVAGDGPLLKRLREEFPWVNFIGPVSRECLPVFYRSADVFVAPSLGGESFGIVLLEAMASGVPVIASDIEGYKNVVVHGVNGLLFQTGSPESLRFQLKELLKNPMLKNNLIKKGLETAEKYSWEKIARRIEEIYLTCLKEGKNGKEKVNPGRSKEKN